MSGPTSSHFSGISSLQTPPGNPDFINASAGYRCRICQRVLRDAMQTTCGHRVCEGCLPTMFDGKQEPVDCPANEDDCEPQRRNSIFVDPGARREVRKLVVFCTNKPYGCKRQLQWRNLEQHERQCEHQPVECQFKDQGCTDILPLKDQEKHEESCKFRPEPCHHCNVMVPRAKHEDHHRNECEGIQHNCPWNCGSQPMVRSELQRHLEICPNKPIECKFRNAGCDFVGNVKEVTEHSLNDMHKHLELTTVYMANMELNTVGIRRQLQEVQAERDQLQQQYQSAMTDIATLQAQIERLNSANKEIKVKMVSLTERIIHMERKVEDVGKKSDVDRHERDVRALQTSLTQVRSQVTQMERQGGATNRPATGGATGSAAENADHARRLDVHETQFAQLDVQMAELDLRFQIVESTSFDGTLLWKLRDYSKRKQEAVSGKTLSLYSQPFYTNRFGYKMCARVYLNGDGMGKGSHLSLFFVVMKGEYDALLPWPFQQKVTMLLLDQDSGQAHLSDTFRPDPTSSSFKRPKSDMNIASGCPLFVAHNVLETPRYVKDDVLYLKFVVDLSGINHP